MIGFLSILLFAYTPFLDDPVVKYQVGWAYNTIFIVIILYNCLQLLYMNLHNFKLISIKYYRIVKQLSIDIGII